MIMDSVDRLPLYANVLPFAAELAARFEKKDAEGLPFEVRFKQYDTKDDEKRKFEVHRHTIDMMMCFEGAEFIHICPEAELIPGTPLPDGGDGRKMEGGPRGTAVLLKPGCFVAILPGEAHMVGGRETPGEPRPVSKWVVKLPAPEAFCVEE